MKKQKNTWSVIKNILLGTVGLCAITAVGVFAVQALPVQTTPHDSIINNEQQTPEDSNNNENSGDFTFNLGDVSIGDIAGGGTVTPSPPALVGSNVLITVFGADCEIVALTIDCTEHSACSIENCPGWVLGDVNSYFLTENEPLRIHYAGGYVNDEFTTKLFVVSNLYAIDYCTVTTLSGEVFHYENTLPLLDRTVYTTLEIYLKRY